jgi:hypothetical protein
MTDTHTIQPLDQAAPDGRHAVKVTCHCQVCAERGIAAIVRTAYADEHHLADQTTGAHTHVHNLVQMANSNLRFAPQVRANGPWVA